MTDTLDETQEGQEAEAVPEPPADEPQEGDEPEQGAQQDGDEFDQGAASEKEIEQAVAKLAKEATRHANRVSEIMGEDAQALLRCELCEPDIPGFRWPTVPADDPRHALIQLLSEGLPAQPPEDDEAQRCERCDGYGVTVTHSRVPGNETRPCSKCNAKGWTSEEERTAYESKMGARKVAAELAAGAFSVAAPAPVTTPATDTWGRPQGAEFFGKDPQFMTPDETMRDWQRRA